jgi:hypothetical protein
MDQNLHLKENLLQDLVEHRTKGDNSEIMVSKETLDYEYIHFGVLGVSFFDLP